MKKEKFIHCIYKCSNPNIGDRIYKTDIHNIILKRWIYDNIKSKFIDKSKYAGRSIKTDLIDWWFEYEIVEINECEALMYLI